MRQERSNENVPKSFSVANPSDIVNTGYESITVVPEIKDHELVHRIRILEHAANFDDVVPASFFDNGNLSFDLARRVAVFMHRVSQVLYRDDMHLT